MAEEKKWKIEWRNFVRVVAKGLAWLKDAWGKLPDLAKNIVIAFSMIILGSELPWRVFGSMGTYISAGMILGGIFLLIYKILPALDKAMSKRK